MAYILFFVAAVIATNGVPHFIKGIIGEKHMTPFGRPSGPVLNVLWGSANFYAGFWLFCWALAQSYELFWASVAVLLGVIFTGVGLAVLWQKVPKARGKLVNHNKGERSV